MIEMTLIEAILRDKRRLERENRLYRSRQGGTMNGAKQTLEVDPERLKRDGETGIFVRAVHRKGDGDRFISVDIVCLNRESLFIWLRSRGGSNPWAEECVALLLGHEYPEVAVLLGEEKGSSDVLNERKVDGTG